MTIDEAVFAMEHYKLHFALTPKAVKAFDMAIKALEQEPCEDCVSRRAVYEIINDAYYLKLDDGAALQESIHQLPSVTPQPKMGRWLPIEYDGYADGSPVWDKWECSECGDEHNGDEESLTAFCPNCGAKMQEIKT